MRQRRPDLLEIKAADAPDLHHRDDLVARPVAQAAARDIEPEGELLRGEQFGLVLWQGFSWGRIHSIR